MIWHSSISSWVISPGSRLSNNLLRLHPDIQIIFFSGYDDYYLDVYNVDHVYFLKKPVDPERLKTALLAAQRQILSLQDKFLTIANKQGVFRIALQEILFLEKSRRLILVHTADGEVFKTYGKFSDFEDSLNSLFFQCHTSYIVNFRSFRKSPTANSLSRRTPDCTSLLPVPFTEPPLTTMAVIQGTAPTIWNRRSPSAKPIIHRRRKRLKCLMR